MGFKLIIKKNDSPSPAFEKFFQKDVVKMGRLPDSDVCLDDRFVSRNQAEIQKVGEEFKIVAKAKSSFTYLNDTQLVNGQGVTLTSEDEIRLPGFSMSFVVCEEKQPEVKAAETVPPSHAPPSPPAHEVERLAGILAFRLRQVFGESRQEDRAKRKELLEAATDEILKPFKNTPIYNEVLSYTESSFTGGSLDTSLISERKRDEAAFEAFENLFRSWNKSDSFTTESDFGQFSGLLKKVMDLFMKNLFESVSMYREFQQEYDVEATKIYNWEKNPLKLAASEQSIQDFFFSRGKKNLGQVTENLNEVHQDIKLHQLGVLKGFKKSLKELLNEMSPAVLAEEAGLGETEKNYKNLFEKLWTKDHDLLWKQYVEKYTDLCENETKTFNTIQKKFQNGYLSFLKQSKSK